MIQNNTVCTLTFLKRIARSDSTPEIITLCELNGKLAAGTNYHGCVVEKFHPTTFHLLIVEFHHRCTKRTHDSQKMTMLFLSHLQVFFMFQVSTMVLLPRSERKMESSLSINVCKNYYANMIVTQKLFKNVMCLHQYCFCLMR